MSEKISAIVFSKDRAAQLKLFLDSVVKNAPGVFNLNVFIEYTDDKYGEAYRLMIEGNKFPGVKFIYPEANKSLYPDSFKKGVLDIMKDKCDYFTFFLDDDIIYKEVKLADITSNIESDDDVVCFSLRLGENTTKCYTLGADNVLHDIDVNGDFMKWDWKLHYLDFGYPFSMDGHIFRRKDIYKLVRKSKFSNVEELEMSLYDFAEMFPRNMMTSYSESRLVNAPAGRVQQSIEDEMTLALKNSEARIRRKAINSAFLDGDFINLELLDFSNIEGCHQKIDLGIAKLKVESSGLDKVAIRQYGKRWDELSEEEQGEINKSIDKIESMVKQKEND